MSDEPWNYSRDLAEVDQLQPCELIHAHTDHRLRRGGVVEPRKRFVGDRHLQDAAQRRPSFPHIELEQTRGIDRVADLCVAVQRS
jgi:hypothetical protein